MDCLPTPPPFRKGQPITRISRACEQCRARKVRCDGRKPCSKCRERNFSCQYRLPPQETPLGSKRAVARSENSANGGDSPCPTIKPSRQVDVRDDPIQLKRHRELRTGCGISNTDTGSFQYFGPSSHHCFIQRIYQRICQTDAQTVLDPASHAADGVRRWKLEPFIFSITNENNDSPPHPDACFTRQIGDAFIDAYFEIIHPQIPVLIHSDIVNAWVNLWKPPWQQENTKGNDILFMVLAIGARVSSSQGQQDVTSSEGWAKYFSHRAHQLATPTEDISLSSTHLSLLKAMFAIQLRRPNEAYLYLGHAARTAMALGINRSQIVAGANPKAHRLRLTFWSIYIQERLCSLFVGRPSMFRDELNDTPCVEDLAVSYPADGLENIHLNHLGPATECAFIRAMSEIGRIADRIAVEIYAPPSGLNMSDIIRTQQATLKYDLEVQSIINQVPVYLHFYDVDCPLGQGWQEIQRMALGNQYYFLRMLMYRPALVFTTLFNSRISAQDHSVGPISFEEAIKETIHCARSIVELNHDVYFRRYPGAKFDGSSMTLVLSACVTLLYDVLDPTTTPVHAKEIFATVEQAIQCLDEMQHIGPANGKALSLDVMKIAKTALRSAGKDVGMSEDLMESFPWLQNSIQEPDTTRPDELQPLDSSVLSPNYGTNPSTAVDSDIHHTGVIPSLASVQGVHYMSHWLEAGFEPEQIPNCMY